MNITSGVNSAESAPSFLVIILDMDSLLQLLLIYADAGNISEFSVNTVAKALITFSNCYALLHRQNRLKIVATMNGSTHILFPIFKRNMSTSFIPSCHTLTATLTRALNDLFGREQAITVLGRSVEQQVAEGSLSQALSCAMTSINRQQQLVRGLQSRILVLQFHKDSTQNYGGLMNSIFRSVRIGPIIYSRLFVACLYDFSWLMIVIILFRQRTEVEYSDRRTGFISIRFSLHAGASFIHSSIDNLHVLLYLSMVLPLVVYMCFFTACV